MRLLRIVALLIALPIALLKAQSSAEIIRGRIFGPDSLPLYQAEVLVTGLQTRATQTTKTDGKGVYTLVFANPENDYLVAVRKLGYISTTFRLSRTGISSVLGADVYMKGAPRLLDTVRVGNQFATQASRDRAAIGEMGSSALVDSLFAAD